MTVDVDFNAINSRKNRLQAHKDFLEAQRAEENRVSAERDKNVLGADYSGYNSIDAMIRGVNTEQLAVLKNRNESFKKRLAELNETIDGFRRLSKEDQAAFFAEANEATRIILETDGYEASQTLTLAQSPGEAQEESAAARLAQQEGSTVSEDDAQAEAARQQADADRQAAELAAAAPVEKLFEGIEKLADGRYKLTVESLKGGNPQIYYGASQEEAFQKLRKAQSHATDALRRRQEAIVIDEDLKSMGEPIDYPEKIEPLQLTPDEIFRLTERRKQVRNELKDPATVIQATRELREIEKKFNQASLTWEECRAINDENGRKARTEAERMARLWMRNNPKFYVCPENIKAFQDLFKGMQWAITPANMDLAFSILVEQDALSSPPDDESENPPAAVQPAPVIPVTPPVVTPAASAPVPAAPASALPAAKRILRPGSSADYHSSTGIQPTTRMPERAAGSRVAPPMTDEEYNGYSATVLKTRYNKDPEFAARCDAYWNKGRR